MVKTSLAEMPDSSDGEIDESYPKYIREHQKELDFLILHEEKSVVKALRQFKVN